MQTVDATTLQGDSCPIFPHVWTAGDKNPGLIFVARDLQLVTDALTIKACLLRPTTILNKTLTTLDEQQASLTWVKDLDLVPGVGQLLTVFSENGSGERTHLLQLLLDVRVKECP